MLLLFSTKSHSHSITQVSEFHQLHYIFLLICVLLIEVVPIVIFFMSLLILLLRAHERSKWVHLLRTHTVFTKEVSSSL